MQGCGIVAENDVEFGKVLVPESVADRGDLPSVRVQPEKVAHLNESQRTELLRLSKGSVIFVNENENENGENEKITNSLTKTKTKTKNDEN